MRRTSQLARTVLRTSRTRLHAPLARTKPPKEANVSGTQPSSRVHKRLASSQPVIDEQHSDQTVLAASDSPPESDPPTEPAPDKPPRRQRVSPTLAKDSDDRPQLPPGLDILWVPDSPQNSTTLPPPELFEDALTNLHIALHPQTQHRAAYSSPAGPPVEPTLALYCPVEGGEYVLDETVRELARRTGAEVLVIDSVHLAAGEWGHFGKGAVISTICSVCALTSPLQQPMPSSYPETRCTTILHHHHLPLAVFPPSPRERKKPSPASFLLQGFLK